MKVWCEKNARNRNSKRGGKVLALYFSTIPVHPLHQSWKFEHTPKRTSKKLVDGYQQPSSDVLKNKCS